VGGDSDLGLAEAEAEAGAATAAVEVEVEGLEEEEEDLFPEAEKALSEKEQTDLGARFEDLKKQRLEAALETKPVKKREKSKK